MTRLTWKDRDGNITSYNSATDKVAGDKEIRAKLFDYENADEQGFVLTKEQVEAVEDMMAYLAHEHGACNYCPYRNTEKCSPVQWETAIKALQVLIRHFE